MAPQKKPARYYNAEQLTEMLAKRYPDGPWAFLTQVRNSTGFSRKVRTADAVAMSLWPSRGLELYGFEIKVSRSDWLTELKNPDKAEEIARFCHRWWIVANKGVVELAELPPAWGLLEPIKNGLKAVREATATEAQEPTYAFLAALLRKCGDSMVPKASIERLLTERFKAGEAAATDRHKWRTRDYDRLKEEVDAFEEASGIKLSMYCGGKGLGEAVRFVRESGLDKIRNKLHGDRIVLKRFLDSMDEAIATLSSCADENGD